MAHIPLTDAQTVEMITVEDLRDKIEVLTRTIADLTRHNKELRDTVAALLSTTPPPGNLG
jgi:hypothetical protein